MLSSTLSHQFNNLIKSLICLFIISYPTIAFAENNFNNSGYYGTFGEKRDKNWLSGVYARFHGDSDGIGFLTSRFSAFAASVEDIEDNNEQAHFVTVDASVGYQIGHQLYLYTDVGIDLGEVIAWLEFSEDDTTLDPDRYFTFGTGVALGNVSLNLYTKYRHISGYYVASQYDWYQGLELGMRF